MNKYNKPVTDFDFEFLALIFMLLSIFMIFGLWLYSIITLYPIK